jgi:Icc protein
MLKLIQISDCHLADDLCYEKHGINTEQAFQKVLDHICLEKPDLIIASGDIADLPSEKTYQRFFQSLHKLNCPIFCIAGNHDDKSLLLTETYMDLGTWQIIGLNSNGPAVHKYGGFLVEAELIFLKAQLEQSHKPTVIVLHHPPIVPNSHWLQEVKLENAHELIKTIEAYPHVKAVLSGHIHYAYEMIQSGIRYMSCPSTYRQFDGKAQEFAIDPILRYGYRRINLQADGTMLSNIHFIEEAL